MKKRLRAYDFGITLGIIGIILSLAAWLGATYNWQSDVEFKVDFPVNVSSKTSSYHNISGNLDMLVSQTKGNKKCKYSIYSQKRFDSGYKTVVSGITFEKNNYFDGITYAVDTDPFSDTRFKVNKTIGVSRNSELAISIGKKGN